MDCICTCSNIITLPFQLTGSSSAARRFANNTAIVHLAGDVFSNPPNWSSVFRNIP